MEVPFKLKLSISSGERSELHAKARVRREQEKENSFFFSTPGTHVSFRVRLSRDFSRLLQRRACSQANLNSQSYTQLLFKMLIGKPLNICNKGQCYKILVSSAAVSLHVGIYGSDLFV